MSQEYVSALAILLVSVLGLFNIKITTADVGGIITGLLAIWVAYRRYQRGDITVAGIRR